MTQDEWIQEMGRLIKERDRAATMIGSWQRKLHETEAAIDVMRGATAVVATEQEQTPEQEQEHVQ